MKEKYLLIGIVSLVIAFVLSTIYRPFIYTNNSNDFGFADVIGSFFSVFTFCFITWGLKEYSNKEKNRHILLATLVYAFLWEFVGYLGIYGTFDVKDIFAGIISGVIAYLVKLIIEK